MAVIQDLDSKFQVLFMSCPPQPETVPFRLGLDLNPTKAHGLLTKSTHLASGLNEARVLDVSFHKEFREKQSDSWEMDLFREKHTPQTDWAILEGAVSFYRVISQADEWVWVSMYNPITGEWKTETNNPIYYN